MKLLPFTAAVLLLGAAVLSAQTVGQVFPELQSISPELRKKPVSSRYFKRPEGGLAFSNRWPQWLNPDSKEWVFALESEQSPDLKAGYIEVVPLTETDFFVIVCSPIKENKPSDGGFHPFSLGQAHIYRVTPNRIETASTWARGDGLHFTQIGVSQWTYDFFESGLLKELSAWRHAPQEISTGDATPSRSRFSSSVYAYWPDSEILQSITETGGMFNKTTVRHFDKTGAQVAMETK